MHTSEIFNVITLSPLHESETVELMCNTFLEEPLTKACAVPREKFMRFCTNVFRHAIAETLAFGLVERTDESLIAFWMCEEDRSFTTSAKEEIDQMPIIEMDPIFEILSRVHDMLPVALDKIWGIQDLTRERILHMFMVGVHEKHRGKGTTIQFTEEVLALSKQRGFTVATAEGTNPGSQLPLLKLGFQSGGEVLYDAPPFDRIPALFGDRRHMCDRTILLIKSLIPRL